MFFRSFVIALAFLSGGCRCAEGSLADGHASVSVTALDFGVVIEGTTERRSVQIINDGRGTLLVKGSFHSKTSADFHFPDGSRGIELEIPAGEASTLEVWFTADGRGADTGKLVLTTNAELSPRFDLPMRTDAISPQLTASVNALTFFSTTARTIERVVTINNEGTAAVRIERIAVEGNDDFGLKPTTAPLGLLEAQSSRTVTVTYARTRDSANGALVMQTDDETQPEVRFELIAAPVGTCGDGVDNDADGLVDFPDDPGCADINESDEENPTECVEGTKVRCGTEVGACTTGFRTCTLNSWSACIGAVAPTLEQCDAIDNDCDGVINNGLAACNANAVAGLPSECTTGATRSCSTTMPGPCHDGVNTCINGHWSATCESVKEPTAEICNGQDDDCDGTADDGLPLDATASAKKLKCIVPGYVTASW